MTTLSDAPRLLVEAELAPLQGTRFQPTGFPDLGAAEYQLPDDTRMLLLESAQSVANRLETVCWDAAVGDLVAPLRGMPYVRVERGGELLTASILEAHRLNSPYLVNAQGFDALREALDPDPKRSFEPRALAAALLRYDPNSLIHGVFMTQLRGVLRLPRLLSGFIEAEGVQVAASGGVKNDRVQADTERGSKKTAKEGYGNVPFHRDEYVAESIRAYFNLDLAQLRSYGLGEAAEGYLIALSLWKVRRFLHTGLRLRTACDLDVQSLEVRRPHAFELPSVSELESQLAEGAAALAGAFADPAVTVLINEEG